MPKFPDATSLGGLPAGADRRVSSFDVGAIERGAERFAQATGRGAEQFATTTGRGTEQLASSLKEGGRALAAAVDTGGQAIGRGVETFGKGLTNLGEGALALELDKERYAYAQSHSIFLTKSRELLNTYAEDQDYGTVSKRFGEDIAKVRDESAATIGSPGLRERFVFSTAPDVVDLQGKVDRHAKTLEGNAQIAWVENQGDRFIDQGTASSDAADHQRIIETHSASIDALAARGYVTPETARNMKQSWAHRYAIADGIQRGNVDPEGVINDLRAKPGSDEAIGNRIIGAEGTGKNPSSSAQGVGQFTDGPGSRS
jgi:hypothetical protein